MSIVCGVGSFTLHVPLRVLSTRAVTRGRCICACDRLPWQPGEWYGSYVHLIKNLIAHASTHHWCSGKLEWRVEARGGGIRRGASDGLQAPAASSWRRQSGGKVGGNAQLRGFDGPLFSPHSARRDCKGSSNGAWLRSGGCDSASNVRQMLEVVMDGITSVVHGLRAR